MIIAGLRAGAQLVAPVALALVLVVAVSPVQGFLVRHGWPRWLSAAVLLLVVYGFLASFALVLVASVGRLAALVPQYADRADELIAQVKGWLADLGVDQAQLAALGKHLDPGHLMDLVLSLLGSLAGLVSNLVFILCLLLFMSLDAGGYPQRMTALTAVRPGLAGALKRFAGGTRSYLLVTTIFGAIVAVLDGGALWALGVPLPLLWGLLSFLTNYIPNVGFIIGLVPPALLALLDGGWRKALWVVVVYCCINFVLQSVIQPKVIGNSIDLTVTLTFLALVFWTWVIGPLGAILAIPLTLLCKALLVDVAPNSRWANHLLTARP